MRSGTHRLNPMRRTHMTRPHVSAGVLPMRPGHPDEVGSLRAGL